MNFRQLIEYMTAKYPIGIIEIMLMAACLGTTTADAKTYMTGTLGISSADADLFATALDALKTAVQPGP